MRTNHSPLAGQLDGRTVVFCVVIALAVGALATAQARRHPSPPRSPLGWPLAVAPSQAASALAGLPTVALAREVAYDRVADFGPAWSDVDHNGCDTRNDILQRDLTDVRLRPGTHSCTVVAGDLDDPYTGAPLRFTKSHAKDVQIDHLVPLHAAWMLGAYRWTPSQRLAYANDPRVLVAVDGAANQDKGDSLADRWRPSDRRGWCAYAVNTVAIHAIYGLGVTAGERAALRRMLGHCR